MIFFFNPYLKSAFFSLKQFRVQVMKVVFCAQWMKWREVNCYRTVDLSLKRTICYPLWLNVIQKAKLQNRALHHDHF